MGFLFFAIHLSNSHSSSLMTHYRNCIKLIRNTVFISIYWTPIEGQNFNTVGYYNLIEETCACVDCLSACLLRAVKIVGQRERESASCISLAICLQRSPHFPHVPITLFIKEIDKLV